MGIIGHVAIADVERRAIEGDQVLGKLIDNLVDTDAHLDLDKSWHAIHYVLNETPGLTALPLGFLMESKESRVGSYYASSVCYHGPAETKAIAKALHSVPFRKQLRAAAFNEEVYGGFQNDEDDREYLEEYWLQLMALVDRAARASRGLFVWYS